MGETSTDPGPWGIVLYAWTASVVVGSRTGGPQSGIDTGDLKHKADVSPSPPPAKSRRAGVSRFCRNQRFGSYRFLKLSLDDSTSPSQLASVI